MLEPSGSLLRVFNKGLRIGETRHPLFSVLSIRAFCFSRLSTLPIFPMENRRVRSVVSRLIETKASFQGLDALAPVGGITFNLFAIPAGTGADERIGNRIRFRGVEIKLLPHNEDMNTGTIYRALLYKYKAGDTNPTNPLAVNIQTPPNTQQITVLHDWFVWLPPQPDDGSSRERTIKLRVPPSELGSPIDFDGPAATDPHFGSYWLHLQTSAHNVLTHVSVAAYWKDG